MLIVRGVNVFPAAIKEIVMEMIPLTTGFMKIDADFTGHSTYEPLKLRVEESKNRTTGHLDLGKMLEDRIRDKLTVKCQISIVKEGEIERPGAQKEKLIERIRI